MRHSIGTMAAIAIAAVMYNAPGTTSPDSYPSMNLCATAMRTMVKYDWPNTRHTYCKDSSTGEIYHARQIAVSSGEKPHQGIPESSPPASLENHDHNKDFQRDI